MPAPNGRRRRRLVQRQARQPAALRTSWWNGSSRSGVSIDTIRAFEAVVARMMEPPGGIDPVLGEISGQLPIPDHVVWSSAPDIDPINPWSPPQPIERNPMPNYMDFTINQLHQLDACRYREPIIKHKGTVKRLIRISQIDDEHYEIVVRATRRMTYQVSGSDMLALDINHTDTRFGLSYIHKVFGSTLRIRFGDWVLGHYGIIINKDTMIDSVRGRRHFDECPSVMIFDTEYDAKRAATIDEADTKFIADPIANVTCGFELETQSTMGINDENLYEMTRGRLAETIMTEQTPDSLYRSIRRFLDGASNEWKKASMDGDHDWLNWCRVNAQTYDMALEKNHITQLDHDYIRSRLQENIDVDTFRERRLLREQWSLPDTIEVVSDESVSGFELRTIGGVSPQVFNEAAVAAFKLNHEIDTRCSFHIHLKAKDVSHKYNRAQRQRIIQYLFRNAGRLPSGVVDRWQDLDANYFFLPDDGQGKYNFINFHGLGTIEFRCFGNVTTSDEAMTCLNLAIESLVFALSTTNKSCVESNNWSGQARKAMGANDMVPNLGRFADAHETYIESIKNNMAIMKEIEPQLIQLESNTFNFQGA